MDKKLELRQIILVTDGESNIGVNPVFVAEEASRSSITINTIGIINGKKREEAMIEIKKIAEAGNGIWELTDIRELSNTIAMLTQKSVYKTIEETVNRELKVMLGTELKDMHPDSRNKILGVIEKTGDEMSIKCCIVLDCSGSMANKIHIAKKSIIHLLRVLKERKGETQVAVVGYPNNNGEPCEILCDFTTDISELEQNIDRIATGGMTPTGPAIQCAIHLTLGIKKENFESNII